jgi:hypothetical protein
MILCNVQIQFFDGGNYVIQYQLLNPRSKTSSTGSLSMMPTMANAGAADGERRRNCLGVRGVLSEVP